MPIADPTRRPHSLAFTTCTIAMAAGLAAVAVLAAGCHATPPPAATAATQAGGQCEATRCPMAHGHVAQTMPPPEPVTLTSDGHRLTATLWRPPGAGPFPAVVYNHGSERDPFVGQRGDVGPFFQQHGFAVLFPNRRGAGGSQGTFWQDAVEALPDTQRDRALVRALEAENADVVAAVRYLQAQPFVDGTQVSVAGCSFGGIESLFSAEKSIGLHAAVDFAGGAMAWREQAPLRERMQLAAARATVPVMFVQAENDYDTTPSRVLAVVMHDHGKPSELHLYPPFGSSEDDGHGRFCLHGSAVWGADVLAFLRQR